MTTGLALACRCGKVRGTASNLSAASGSHLVCYCEDCQRFQHFLGRQSDVLDNHGGTEIFQTSAGNIAFSSGQEHVACMRMRPDGTVRWYADCCNTPIGNTLATPAIPFLGLITACLRAQGEDATVSEALGPVRYGVHGRRAIGEPALEKVYATFTPLLIVRFLARALRWRLRGDHRRSPFFDAAGKLLAQPRILSANELKELEAKRAAFAAERAQSAAV